MTQKGDFAGRSRERRSFTLLEILVAMTLLMIAAGAVSWKLVDAIEKKKFQSHVTRIQIQLESCYRLAINTRADWYVELESCPDRLFVKTTQANGSGLMPFQPRAFPIDPLKITFNGKEAERLVLCFSPTGKVIPEGVLSLSNPRRHLDKELLIPELFERTEKAEREGPAHPDEYN